MPGPMKNSRPATWTSSTSRRFTDTCSRTSMTGREKYARSEFRRTAACFCCPENIESEAKKLFTQLEKDDFLQDLSPKEFAEKSAPFLACLNAIHAFREGNGRTQLSFFLLLADQAGHSIDLEELDPEAFLAAMITSFKGDEAPLAAVIQDLVED